MNNAIPVPADLRRDGIYTVTDNRQPGDEIRIDAPTFVSIFHGEIKEWVLSRRMARAESGSDET